MKKRYANSIENLLNTTGYLKNSTSPLYACTYAAEDTINYGVEQLALYNNSVFELVQAMTTSLFANGIRVKSILD